MRRESMKKAFEKYKEAGASLVAPVETAWFLDQLLQNSTISCEQSSLDQAIEPPNTPPVLAVLARLLLTLAELDEVYGRHVKQG